MHITLNTPYGVRVVSKSVLETLLIHADSIAFQELIGVDDPLQLMVEIDKKSVAALSRSLRHIDRKCKLKEGGQ